MKVDWFMEMEHIYMTSNVKNIGKSTLYNNKTKQNETKQLV